MIIQVLFLTKLLTGKKGKYKTKGTTITIL